MSAATINTFPPVHTFDSPRSWAMAIIVLLHLGVFWALTAGMAVRFTTAPNESIGRVIEPLPENKDPPSKPDEPVIERKDIVVVVDKPQPIPNDDRDVITGEQVLTDDVVRRDEGLGPVVPQPTAPVTVEPAIDPRFGFTKPVYPVPEIRMGNEGTVTLSLQILENGRVGEVRVDRSSGFARLDESAVREARRWRFRPGTRDGAPVVMWKQLPVTFQLQ